MTGVVDPHFRYHVLIDGDSDDWETPYKMPDVALAEARALKRGNPDKRVTIQVELVEVPPA